MKRRLTMAQNALVESDEARAVLADAERFARYHYPNWAQDELCSEAREALVLAALDYDPRTGKSFGAIASRAIFYAYRTHVRVEQRRTRRWRAAVSSAPFTFEREHQAEGDDVSQADARMKLRLRDMRLGVTLHMLAATPPPTPERALRASRDYKRTLALLEDACAKLPADQAAIIRHHICEDEAITAVAERLGCSRFTIHRKLNAALETLREELDTKETNPLSA